ncbi:ankyrin repeat-containing domain protein [Leptodontidium sp. MPI-SDFR-AT-0119]|nr:ankyrin repeat-containing domain protein [Leptodontidium sp. MPI-SDFR-AT-0119]
MTGVEVTSSSAQLITPPMSSPASFNVITIPESSDCRQLNRPRGALSRCASVSLGQSHSPISIQKSSSVANAVARYSHSNPLTSSSGSFDCMKESREFATIEVHPPILSSHKPMTGKTTLHLSTKRGHDKIVRYVIECGAEVNSVDSAGRTALHYASAGGHAEIVGILLDAGADIDAVDGKGWTALHMAADCGHVEVLMLLVNDGADLDATIGRSSSESGSAGGS